MKSADLLNGYERLGGLLVPRLELADPLVTDKLASPLSRATITDIGKRQLLRQENSETVGWHGP